MSGSSDNPFAERLLDWFDQFGRKSLPWQSDRDPYRVWVSEIMLQQTQVSAVIPYYERFMARFPDVGALAAAPPDDVLHHWSGLGYYARARNLHKAAGQIVDQHGGVFPREIDAVIALPGIGRSTAGAILAFCFGQRHPILDGNVKRVLARYYAIEGFPGTSAVSKQLWTLADSLTPADRVGDYTQAIMDLGATLCTRTRPLCAGCPQAIECAAHAQGTPTAYPHRKPQKARPMRSTTMLILVDAAGKVLLERRPPTGIWGGLWSFPEVADESGIAKFLQKRDQRSLGAPEALPSLQHGFTHFQLTIEPVTIRVQTTHRSPEFTISDDDDFIWVTPGEPADLGLPKPVTTLLQQLAQSSDLADNVIT